MAPSRSASSSAIRQLASCASSDDTAQKQLQHTEDDSENLVEYRRIRDIPFELREHCVICFEEGLYSQAISLLQSLLLAENLSTSASSALVSTKEPLIRPPSSHLALAATLVVHPSVTTRASSAEQLAASDAALRLLHATNDVLGPVNARFGAAFSFSAMGHASRGSNRRRHQYGHDGSGSTPHSPAGSDDLDFGQKQGDGNGGVRSSSALDTPLATTSSLFSCADDFWHMVGWAFNCSIRHPMRWQRWKLLVGFLLDAIEDDLAERTAPATETNDHLAEPQMEEYERTNATRAGRNVAPLLIDSLLLRYCNNAEGRTGRRRIMRAILADGSDRSMREFREVFLKETVEKKKDYESDREKERHKEGRREINFDEGLYGDYDSSDDEFSVEKQPARSTRKANSQVPESAAARSSSSETRDGAKNEEQQDNNTPRTAANDFGGMESVLLRQRALLLLSYLSAALPTAFTTLSDLFALFTEFLRPLPLRHFTLFLQSSLLLPPTFRNCLLQMLIRPLIAAATPRDEIPEPTAAEVEKFFLQHAAASVSVADNAKVSIILEGLVGGLIRAKKESGKNGNNDENYRNDEGESGYRRESGPGRRDGTSSNGNCSRSRSVSRTRRRSELSRRSEDSCSNNNINNNITTYHRKKFPSSSTATTITATKESFMSAVREGTRKRAEKARKKNNNNTASSSSSAAAAGSTGTASAGGTAASRSTKKTENEEDREILEMSAERLILMAEAIELE